MPRRKPGRFFCALRWKTVAAEGDVPKKGDRGLFAEAKQAFGGLDMLTNNAGVYEFLPLEALTEEHFHRLLDLTYSRAHPLLSASGGSL